MDRFELGVVVVGALGHDAVVPTRGGRRGSQGVGVDELKPLRDLDLAWFFVNWLFGTVIDLVNVARSQRVGEIDSRLGDVLRGLQGALIRMSKVLVPDVLSSPLP